MATLLARHWWLLAIRGLAAILFGIGAFVWPGITLTVLVLLVGSYALVDGIFALAAAIRLRGQMPRWWLMALEGVVGILFGVGAFIWPGSTALVLVSIMAAWSIVTGLFEIGMAIQLRKVIQNELLLILSGIISVVFGILLAVQPGAGALSLVWLIGVYALAFGSLTLGLAFRLRGLREPLGRQAISAA